MGIYLDPHADCGPLFARPAPSVRGSLTSAAAADALAPATPRRIELARRGLIVEAGTRRSKSGRMATAWQATAASR